MYLFQQTTPDLLCPYFGEELFIEADQLVTLIFWLLMRNQAKRYKH